MIISENGTNGFCLEHSNIDGQVMTRIIQESISTSLEGPKCINSTYSIQELESHGVKAVQWNLKDDNKREITRQYNTAMRYPK